jgi:hypothetical protein
LAFQSYLNRISGAPLSKSVIIRWRFGLACFAGFGGVADKIDNFRLNKLKYFVGWGIRYVFDVHEKINLRLDFGYAKNSSVSYIYIGEAF